MKIAILGSTGLLGNAVSKYFIESTNHEVVCTFRNKEAVLYPNSIFLDATKPDFSFLKGFDYVINCIGIIKPFMKDNLRDNIFVNSMFPRDLADHCKKEGIRLIHITSDCVYSGKDGDYDEDSYHDCLDEYGKSKSLGEPNNCLVLRTSIIGEEIHKNASLISWCKSMKGKEVNGYVNHIWNGVTTKHYAEICEQIIKNDLYKEELYHIFSTTITKHDLLKLIDSRFNLNLTIKPHIDTQYTNRNLTTKKDLVSKLNIKSIEQQIQEI